jgi:hypothetical protein
LDRPDSKVGDRFDSKDRPSLFSEIDQSQRGWFVVQAERDSSAI